TVDLELVDRELLQVCQRRVAGAEVIERDLYPEGGDRLECGNGTSTVGHQDRLDDLELKPVPGNPPKVELRAKVSDEGRIQEIGGRDVDGHRQVTAGVKPRAVLRERLVEHRGGQL